jgi:hypothetical protein
MPTFSRDVRLYRCAERQIGVWLPIPLSGRLDVLRDIGQDAWAPTRRKELVSALLLDAPADAGSLQQMLTRYRAAKVSDAFIQPYENWRFLYPPDSPGPREQLDLWGNVAPSEPPAASADEPLAGAKDYRTGMMVASPLAWRLKVLLSIARETGERTSQRELIGAVVLAAPSSGPRLARMLGKYWHGTVADALIAGRDESAVPAVSHSYSSRSAAARRQRRTATRPRAKQQPIAPADAKRSVTTRVEAPNPPKDPSTQTTKR